MSDALTLVEFDLPVCQLTYGEAPCTAELGVTGDIKCFNSRASCQDPENLDTAPVTLRFAMPADYLPPGFDAMPSIESVSFTPPEVSLGEDVGQRASVRINFRDHRHSDTGPGGDPYHDERDYDPFEQGTFWGKFRARFPALRGLPIRIIRGRVGQALEEMETRHYVIDSIDGPKPGGTFTIIAKDPLKFLDGDRAKAPRLSSGFLVGAISDIDTTADLVPVGIGDAEYPASGHVTIGGSEVCAFTRDGDTLILTERGALGSEAQDHDEQSRVQLTIRIESEDPADIINNWLVNYADLPAEYINLQSWKDEVDSHPRRVYTGTITEPTAVRDLVSELIKQAALSMWWDDIGQRIRLRVLREIPTDALVIGGDGPVQYLPGTLDVTDQPAKRVSQPWTFFAQRDPTAGQDDEDNYRSSARTADLEAEEEHGSAAIHKIFSRWIPAGGRPVALRLNDILLGRFRIAPRRFSFELLRDRNGAIPVELGQGARLRGWVFQHQTGEDVDVPIQITRLDPSGEQVRVEAEEMRFTQHDPDDLDDRVIIIDSNMSNVNLRDVHDLLYPALEEGNTVTAIIESSVRIGSIDPGQPTLVAGDWPEDITPLVVNRGRIQGAGGDGGRSGGSNGGRDGGDALVVSDDIELNNVDGEIWGGGGGGQGSVPGNGGSRYGGVSGVNNTSGSHGTPGTIEAPGSGGSGGSSNVRSGGSGGAAGGTIIGIGNVTFVDNDGDPTGDDGDIRGPTS